MTARLTPTEIEAIRKRLDEDVNTNDGEETAVAYVQAFRDRRALLSDRDAGAWRPISEVPAKSKKHEGDPILIGWWEGDVWTERRAWWAPLFESIGPRKYRGAWTDNCVASFGYEEVQEYHPTHFQVLPAPPSPTRVTVDAP